MSPSGADKEVLAYNFVVGGTELIILHELLTQADLKTPKSFFTMSYRARLKDMKGKISEALSGQGVKIPKTLSGYKVPKGETL